MRTIVFQDTKHALRLWNIQCILAWEESQMAKTLLHTGLTCGHHPPNLKTPPSWDLEQHDFLINILSSMFSRSDVGALWCPHLPSMLVWKGLGKVRNGSVLWFGFVCGGFHTRIHFSQEVLPVARSLRVGTIANGSLSKVKWGLLPSVSLWKEESPSTYGLPGTLFFSGALATATTIFISFPQISETV